jgi:hypothetical protein
LRPPRGPATLITRPSLADRDEVLRRVLRRANDGNLGLVRVGPGTRRDDAAVAAFVLERLAVMRSGKVLQRTDRHDAGRVDLVMRRVIVPLDVIEVHRRRDAAHLVEVAQIAR